MLSFSTDYRSGRLAQLIKLNNGLNADIIHRHQLEPNYLPEVLKHCCHNSIDTVKVCTTVRTTGDTSDI